MAQNPKAKATLFVVLGLALSVGTIAGIARHRSAEKAQLLADIQRVEIPVARYALETSGSSRPPGDSAWRAYCEHERVTLIEEARVAANR